MARERENKVISFKLTQEEYDALMAMQDEDEKSPSLVAKRLIREALQRELPHRTDDIALQIEARLEPVLKRLEDIEGKLAA